MGVVDPAVRVAYDRLPHWTHLPHEMSLRQPVAHEVRHRNPSKVVVAVPVAPYETIAELKPLTDDIVVLYTPLEAFGTIGAFYFEFTQLSDAEVVDLMKKCLPRAHDCS